jgi:cell division septation protein DedD
MFRVRIGPYEERQSAERVAENVRRSYRLDTWITQNS